MTDYLQLGASAPLTSAIDHHDQSIHLNYTSPAKLIPVFQFYTFAENERVALRNLGFDGSLRKILPGILHQV
jgi:hypothetical protein